MQPTASVFVAGHRGLIGSAVLRQLDRRGHRNVVVAERSALDLADGPAVARFLHSAQPEYVVLAAGKVGGIVANKTQPADFIDTNLAIQGNVLRAARDAGVKRLIFFGSSCMYPRECAQPMAETALYTGHPEPTSMAYAVAKLAGVQTCLAYNAQYGAGRFVPVIPNSAFGPQDDFDPASGHVLSALIARFHAAKMSGAPSVTLWGTGTPRREFVYADDIADACLDLLDADLSAVELPLNLGSGDDFSIRELAERIATVVGYVGRIEWDTTKPDGAPRKLLDCARLRALGWRPRTSFDAALRATYAWYVDHAATGIPA